MPIAPTDVDPGGEMARLPDPQAAMIAVCWMMMKSWRLGDRGLMMVKTMKR